MNPFDRPEEHVGDLERVYGQGYRPGTEAEEQEYLLEHHPRLWWVTRLSRCQTPPEVLEQQDEAA